MLNEVVKDIETIWPEMQVKWRWDDAKVHVVNIHTLDIALKRMSLLSRGWGNVPKMGS